MHSKQTNFTMDPGSSLRWEQSCGGGYGNPLERDPEQVLRDWMDELITIDSAREAYGVVIAEDGHSVDLEATAALRAERSGG